ncbi:MAG: PRC-barrel domain-containing protein [Phycisphaerae bacterium]
MLRSLNEILEYRLQATDDKIGRVKDFFFDDHSWVVRYLVADTGTWLRGRMVLISPESFQEPNWSEHTVPVNLTTQQIERSPSVASDQPVSRQKEIEVTGYYRWPMYWTHLGVPAVGAMPVGVAPRGAKDARKVSQTPQVETAVARGEPTLRSFEEVSGYHIQAVDDEIGHVEDLVADTDGWRIRYLVVDTRNWLPGKKVLVAPDWIRDISWDANQVKVDLTREKIKDAPEFDPSSPVNREYEARLYDYYGAPRYWEDGQNA